MVTMWVGQHDNLNVVVSRHRKKGSGLSKDSEVDLGQRQPDWLADLIDDGIARLYE